jgi:thiol-disulfide isomerase/thioredoxin
MNLNDKNYKDNLKGISVIEFSGESCANCLTLMPILHNLLKDREDLKLFHVEAGEDTKEILSKYEIYTVPTIMILNNDKEFVRCRGFQPEEILELWLNSKVEELKKSLK